MNAFQEISFRILGKKMNTEGDDIQLERNSRSNEKTDFIVRVFNPDSPVLDKYVIASDGAVTIDHKFAGDRACTTEELGYLMTRLEDLERELREYAY